jgi:NitT/TauT family transport system ATP-binding protein
MDEPFQSLDSPTADSLRSLLLDYWTHNNASVLYVTHNLREAIMMADRILFFSSRPACIINEVIIDLPRPRMLDGGEVNALYEKLLKEHPQLLSGLSGKQEDTQDETVLNKKVGEWHASRIG